MRTPISRRNLFKYAASSLALNSCFKLPITPEHYNIHWLHLEGAPYRVLFDLWPSLDGTSSLPGVKTNKLIINTRELTLPEVWSTQNTNDSILNNWLSIRGITTQSPHLLQCRREWFSLLNEDKSINSQPERTLSLKEIFSQWKSPKATTKPNIGPYVVDSFVKGEEKVRFETIGELNSKNVEHYKSFYTSLIQELTLFVELLKKQQTFDKTVIIITNDRGRAPASKDFPTLIEPVWQGANMSLISGSIRGPINLGDIYKQHPKYPEAYPGTWGTPTSQWTPREVFQLIKDLHLPQERERTLMSTPENPWISPRPLQGFFVKLPSGKTI